MWLMFLWVFVMLQLPAVGASVDQIGEGKRHPMQGKEIDWIDGDYVLRNDQVVAVIARPQCPTPRQHDCAKRWRLYH